MSFSRKKATGKITLSLRKGKPAREPGRNNFLLHLTETNKNGGSWMLGFTPTGLRFFFRCLRFQRVWRKRGVGRIAARELGVSVKKF